MPAMFGLLFMIHIWSQYVRLKGIEIKETETIITTSENTNENCIIIKI